MSESDAVAEAVALLIRRKDELMAELRGLQDAINALERLRGGTAPVAPTATGPRPSVRTMLVTLLGEDDRDWSAAEVLDEYQRRGTPVHGNDPENALRAAISDANKAGQIFRTATGRYKASKWQEGFWRELNGEVVREAEEVNT